MSIEQYKISLDIEKNIVDSSIVLIGVNKKTLEAELYGYDYDIEIIKTLKNTLEEKFKEHLFFIKRFDIVL